MDMQLKGKVALVTGASIGIGRTIATMLAAEGCRLAIVARRTALLETLADETEKGGADRPLVLTQDICARDAAERLHMQVLARFGRCDILVNNAGASNPLTGFGTEEEWERSMLLNFTAARRITHAFIPDMQKNRFGRVINLTGADEPLNLNAANPPNGATHIWQKGLSRLVAKDNITINSIPPGRIHSEQIDTRIMPTEEIRNAWLEAHCPAGYVGEPEDLAVLVVFLASPRARYITGQVIYVDGGARRFAH
jgi:3-oxoacyl-[acyl-carrier protein] reductase